MSEEPGYDEGWQHGLEAGREEVNETFYKALQKIIDEIEALEDEMSKLKKIVQDLMP